MQCCKNCFLGYEEEFVARPLGESANQNIQVQAANGAAARMVLYRYDFLACGPGLTLRGKDQLAKIVARSAHNGFPIVIERTPECPGLAEARRLVVLNELAHGPIPVPPERVVIGPPLAIGLRGIDAVLIHDNLLKLTQQGPQGGISGGAAVRTPAGGAAPGGATPTGAGFGGPSPGGAPTGP
jgi:hypothetical protein